MNMAFRVVFLAHAPDAEPEKHRCVIETSKYKLFVVLAKDQEQAIEVWKSLLKRRAFTQSSSAQDSDIEILRR